MERIYFFLAYNTLNFVYCGVFGSYVTLTIWTPIRILVSYFIYILFYFQSYHIHFIWIHEQNSYDPEKKHHALHVILLSRLESSFEYVLYFNMLTIYNFSKLAFLHCSSMGQPLPITYFEIEILFVMGSSEVTYEKLSIFHNQEIPTNLHVPCKNYITSTIFKRELRFS